MRQAVIVIGSSYGDEGKGLAAAWAAKRAGTDCLNILINGGAQRGHTVETADGFRHVFRHFGSACAAGAVSFADEDFIVNPLLYEQERHELDTLGLRPRLLVSARCRVSLPWDMMLGQIIEENRGAARHGSCGCGIQETRLRFLETDWALRFDELARLTETEFSAYCRRIAEEHLPARLGRLSMGMDDGWRAVIAQEGLIRSAWQDWQSMLAHTEICAGWEDAAAGRPLLLFEAGQGLALDAENREDFPYLTPSRTTSLISAKRIAALAGKTDTEILYVTRSYLTRHGAGPLPTECPKERINPDMTDRTNIPNPHQQTLRYGWFDSRAVLKRILADRDAARKVLPDASASVMVTHLNETGGALAGGDSLEAFCRHFDRAYLSDSPWSAREAGG